MHAVIIEYIQNAPELVICNINQPLHQINSKKSLTIAGRPQVRTFKGWIVMPNYNWALILWKFGVRKQAFSCFNGIKKIPIKWEIGKKQASKPEYQAATGKEHLIAWSFFFFFFFLKRLSWPTHSLSFLVKFMNEYLVKNIWSILLAYYFSF